MQREEQFVSYHLSQQLKQVGVTQDALHYWDGRGHLFLKEHTALGATVFHDWYSAAFTVAELGLLLPEWSTSCRNPEGLWDCYPPALYGEAPAIYNEDTEANVRAKLLIAIYRHYPHYPSLDYATVAG